MNNTVLIVNFSIQCPSAATLSFNAYEFNEKFANWTKDINTNLCQCLILSNPKPIAVYACNSNWRRYRLNRHA